MVGRRSRIGGGAPDRHGGRRPGVSAGGPAVALKATSRATGGPSRGVTTRIGCHLVVTWLSPADALDADNQREQGILIFAREESPRGEFGRFCMGGGPRPASKGGAAGPGYHRPAAPGVGRRTYRRWAAGKSAGRDNKAGQRLRRRGGLTDMGCPSSSKEREIPSHKLIKFTVEKRSKSAKSAPVRNCLSGR